MEHGVSVNQKAVAAVMHRELELPFEPVEGCLICQRVRCGFVSMSQRLRHAATTDDQQTADRSLTGQRPHPIVNFVRTQVWVYDRDCVLLQIHPRSASMKAIVSLSAILFLAPIAQAADVDAGRAKCRPSAQRATGQRGSA